MHPPRYRVAALAFAAMLTACATSQKPLYQWANYQGQLYQYFQAGSGSPGEQIAMLEAQIQKNKVAGESTPPGLHGHLALLYSKMGNDVAARQHLEAERTLFPESATYIDFLLKNAAKTAPKS